MKQLLLILILFISHTAHTQTNYELSKAMDFFQTQKIFSGENKNILTESDIEGSPYLTQEFITGSVFTSSKVQYQDVPLRYNVYNDEMQFKSPDGVISAIAAPEIIEKITFGDYTMEYIPFINSKKIRRGFFILIEDGDSKLYARPNVDYNAPEPAAPFKDPEPAKFIEKPHTYYIRVGMEAAQMLESKKDVEAIFPDHKKEIADFIKKNKVKHRNEDKLKELVKFYNSL